MARRATRDSYIRAIGAKCLISAVARVYEPGCQADHMLVLEGPQGAGKSSAVAILGKPWFTDQIADLHSKDASQDLRGKWIFEMPELSAVRGKELERVKAYVSRRSDHYPRRLWPRHRRLPTPVHLHRHHQRKRISPGPHRQSPVLAGRLHGRDQAR